MDSLTTTATAADASDEVYQLPEPQGGICAFSDYVIHGTTYKADRRVRRVLKPNEVSQGDCLSGGY